MRGSPFQMHHFDPQTKIHRVHLHDGGVCVMYSKDNGSKEESFQTLAEHQVPLYKEAKGWRLNWTIRTEAPLLDKTDLSSYTQRYDLGDGLSLLLKKIAYDPLLKQELFNDLHAHGYIDETLDFHGVMSQNGGRMSLQQAYTPGRTYTYGGKTTPPGIVFGPRATAFLEQYAAKEFGTNDLWAHIAYYPNAHDCKLSWHGDKLDGINPHMIMSVTFLEDPIEGIRPFDVRLISEKEKNQDERETKRTKMQPITKFFTKK